MFTERQRKWQQVAFEAGNEDKMWQKPKFSSFDPAKMDYAEYVRGWNEGVEFHEYEYREPNYYCSPGCTCWHCGAEPE